MKQGCLFLGCFLLTCFNLAAMESKEEKLEKYKNVQEIIENARKNLKPFIDEMQYTYEKKEWLKEELQMSIYKKMPSPRDTIKEALIENELDKEKKIFKIMEAIRKHIMHPDKPIQPVLAKVFFEAQAIQEVDKSKETFNSFIEQQRENYWK